MNEFTQNYKDLIVWQKGIELAKIIYRLTATLPQEERFGLTSQMRRARGFGSFKYRGRDRRDEQHRNLSISFHMPRGPRLNSTLSLF